MDFEFLFAVWKWLEVSFQEWFSTGGIYTAGVFGFVGFLLKGYITKSIDASIQYHYNQELERYKTELVLNSHKQGVMFTKLHEKRAEFIALFYYKLFNLTADARRFANIPSHAIINEVESMTEYIRSAREAYKLYNENRLYFPERLSDAIDSFMSGLSEIIEYNANQLSDANSLHQQEDEMRQTFAKLDSMYVSSMLHEIADEFRSLIGVND